MELRVWVDGVQRIVCGVRLTTTCQEIVFVLAKATHQAGRFTMIERWRNNERLLSPNEQPLVTLQRWGEHMNEVDFILKKASSDIPAQPNQLSQQNRAPQLPNHIANNNHDKDPQVPQHQQQQMVGASNGGNMRTSPMNSMQPARNNQQFIEPSPNYQYNLNRRPQTSLGPLTSSSSALGIGSVNFPQQLQKSALNPMVMRNSLSTSTLPDLPKPIQTNNILSSNARYIEEQLMNSSPSSLYGPVHNGYPKRSESNIQLYFNNLQQADQQVQQQPSKNHPFEELYGTINKKRIHNPPAVPAKPRVVVPITSMANHQSYPSPLQPTINNAQGNYFNGSRNSPSANFHNNLRPRNPPGYNDYLEALASRNSSGHSVIPSGAYIPHSQSNPHGNNPISTQQANSVASQSYTDNRIQDRYTSGPSPSNYCNSSLDESDRIPRNTVRSRIGEPGFVINLGSAVNVKLPPNNLSTNQTQDGSQRLLHSTKSVSEIGHDMLKMIEEQKKVLLNQKDELDKLDNDRDYWETKQNSEQVELVNRIENEIHHLEELWRENQAQISKLENQDLEREVQDLKSEQYRIEAEIRQQRRKLICCEEKISSCEAQIDKLESELARYMDTTSSDASSTSNEAEESASTNATNKGDQADDPLDPNETTKTNGTTSSSDNNCVRDGRSSDGEDDFEDDSEGDYSDDLNLATAELKSRAAKDVAYVDKRGLISGIRSLKLDKSRGPLLSKQPSDHHRYSTDSTTEAVSDSHEPKDKNGTPSSNNNNVNKGCLETNGQYSAKTATSNGQYEFLMTL